MNFKLLFCVVIQILVLSVFILDFIPMFFIWQSRIKIGRYTDKKVWIKSIEKKSIQWLKKTPTIKLTDNSRLIFIDMLRGNYKRSTIQSWQEAALVLGITAQYTHSNDTSLKKAIDDYVQIKITPFGTWKIPITETDGVIMGYALIQTPWLDHHHLKPAYDALWHLMLRLKGKEETVSYKPYTQNYRYVDTIGFICPFLVEYGQKFKVPEAVDLALIQIEEFNRYALLGDTFIPCHTYTIKSKLPVGLFGWGRGLGWYAIGLIDAWCVLDATHPKKQKMTLWVEQFARMAISFQRDNGSWGWIVMQDNARSDSSTTATLAWFLKNAAAVPTISKDCQQAVDKAIRYLMTVTRRDGAIDFSQGDTKGIGVHSQEFDILPFTQGFALRTLNHLKYE